MQPKMMKKRPTSSKKGSSFTSAISGMPRSNVVTSFTAPKSPSKDTSVLAKNFSTTPPTISANDTSLTGEDRKATIVAVVVVVVDLELVGASSSSSSSTSSGNSNG